MQHAHGILENMSEAAEQSGNKAPSRLESPAGSLSVVALILAAAAVLIGGYQWYQGRGAGDDLRRDLAGRLAAMETQNREAAAKVAQSAAALREAEIKIGVLESRLAESQSQQIALEALHQELSRNRDEAAFAEIEQSVLLASQQLQVAGNVRAALIGLENADARLQRLDQPRYAPLRRALVRDIERLKGLPQVDVHGTSLRLNEWTAGIDKLTLAMEARTRDTNAPQSATAAQTPAWERMVREAWQELRGLVRIQSTGGSDAALLTPDQVFFLRENLKLRLLGARHALLARDARSYQAELGSALAMLDRYFAKSDMAVAAAAASLRRLQAMPVAVDVPDLAETLDALRKLRVSRVKSPA